MVLDGFLSLVIVIRTRDIGGTIPRDTGMPPLSSPGPKNWDFLDAEMQKTSLKIVVYITNTTFIILKKMITHT